MKRLYKQPGWEEELTKWMSDQFESSWEWGVNDCCSAACRCIWAMTGEDIRPMMARFYSTETEALEILETLGGDALNAAERVLERQWGCERISPDDAQAGDVLCFDLEHGPTISMCTGIGGVLITKRRMSVLPLSRAEAAWRIEECR